MNITTAVVLALVLLLTIFAVIGGRQYRKERWEELRHQADAFIAIMLSLQDAASAAFAGLVEQYYKLGLGEVDWGTPRDEDDS